MADPKIAPDAQSRTFEDARQETLECGFLLACYQTLLLAMRDRRLQFKHRAVLAVLIEHMNSKSGMTWIGRDRIAEILFLAVETISNTLRELSLFGYILAENRRTPETSNRSLRHYTLAGLSKDEIRAKIADAIADMKARGPRAVKGEDHPAKVTAYSDFESHRPQCVSVDIDNQKSPPAVDESHRRQWTVTNVKELIDSEVLANQSSHAPETPLLVIDEGKPARRKGRPTGKRPWSHVHKSEKEQLFEMCKAYAAEHGWPPGHLRQRLETFALHQRDQKPASGDWEAYLLKWLGDPRFQPRAGGSNRRGPASAEDIAAQAFGGPTWERS